MPKLAVLLDSPFIFQYLLCHSGYGAQLVERGTAWFTGCWDVFAASIANIELEVLADILAHLKPIESQLVEEPINAEPNLNLGLQWVFTTGSMPVTADTIFSCRTRSEAISSIRLLAEFGRVLYPFDAGYSKDLASTNRFMDIYLAAGGNPNMPTRRGHHPLVTALALICQCLRRDPDHNEKLVDGDGTPFDDEVPNCSDITNREYAVELLAMLITAGADVTYANVTVMACCLNVEDIWAEALTRCGLNITEMHAESIRRLHQRLKLHGASRTGVDVEPIIDQPSTSGLRQRHASTYTET